mmetsp:Transcript_4438/g.17462  ORF Transcript_4438/g.17462 Transcript_4438/m.17462 type:complete len:316 (-) Transcript_4438:256-1203(-)
MGFFFGSLCECPSEMRMFTLVSRLRSYNLDNKHQRGVGRNRSVARPLRTVAQRGRDGDSSDAALAHTLHAAVHAFDDLPGAEPELEGPPSVHVGVEHPTVLLAKKTLVDQPHLLPFSQGVSVPDDAIHDSQLSRQRPVFGFHHPPARPRSGLGLLTPLGILLLRRGEGGGQCPAFLLLLLTPRLLCSPLRLPRFFLWRQLLLIALRLSFRLCCLRLARPFLSIRPCSLGNAVRSGSHRPGTPIISDWLSDLRPITLSLVYIFPETRHVHFSAALNGECDGAVLLRKKQLRAPLLCCPASKSWRQSAQRESPRCGI